MKPTVQMKWPMGAALVRLILEPSVQTTMAPKRLSERHLTGEKSGERSSKRPRGRPPRGEDVETEPAGKITRSPAKVPSVSPIASPQGSTEGSSERPASPSPRTVSPAVETSESFSATEESVIAIKQSPTVLASSFKVTL